MDTGTIATVVARLRAAFEAVQDSELERLYGRLPKLNENSRQEIKQFSDRLVAKMLDPPVNSLDNETGNGTDTLVVALQSLFRLDRMPEPKRHADSL
jgi:glutamyl-tRNA reductase